MYNIQNIFMYIGIIDCNNFYVSCERIMKPRLDGKPVVVMSRNNACAIARSNEAKALGIKMGQPLFEFKHLVAKHNVQVLTARFPYYALCSERVMRVVSEFVPVYTQYSIDEAFICMDAAQMQHDKGVEQLRATIQKWTGIPVSIGLGKTKTQAKVAVKVAKKLPGGIAIYDERMLDNLDVEDLWGISFRTGRKLRALGLATADRFIKADPKMIRKRFTICGERVLRELQGYACYPFHPSDEAQDSMSHTRSFGFRVYGYDHLSHIVFEFVYTLVAKLKQKGLYAQKLTIFIDSDLGRVARDISFDHAHRHLNLFLKHTEQELRSMFSRRARYYKRAGITAHNLTTHTTPLITPDLKSQKITKALDAVNEKFGEKIAILGLS